MPHGWSMLSGATSEAVAKEGKVVHLTTGKVVDSGGGLRGTWWSAESVEGPQKEIALLWENLVDVESTAASM